MSKLYREGLWPGPEDDRTWNDDSRAADHDHALAAERAAWRLTRHLMARLRESAGEAPARGTGPTPSSK